VHLLVSTTKRDEGEKRGRGERRAREKGGKCFSDDAMVPTSFFFDLCSPERGKKRKKI